MATRQEIIDTIDAFLERRITIEKAYQSERITAQECLSWVVHQLQKKRFCD